MIFSSYEFIFLFLPVVLIGYYLLVPPRGRMMFLTLASYFFYGWWDYRFCSLMIFSTIIDFQCGRGISRSDERLNKRLWLLLSIVTNLSLLGFFKYYNLTAETVNGSAEWLGLSIRHLPLWDIVLPVGISFYTFQSMSYSIDIYQGHARPARKFIDFACYVALFPQLIAGPIVRYRELADQLVERTHTWAKATTGIALFILGLAKKVLLADGVAGLADMVFNQSAPGFITAWLGALSYTVQIYFDFSGYSDMAVGLGLLFGFTLPQNFNSPYKSISITDFWRRWHISLSNWLRDYLYIPLGGNKKGGGRTLFNLFATMLLGGLWHGASWTFVLWGGYHGVLLAIERGVGKRGLFYWAPNSVQRGATFVLVVFGWILFRAVSLDQVAGMFQGLMGLNGWGLLPGFVLHDQILSIIILILALAGSFALPNTWEMKLSKGKVQSILLVLLLILCVMAIMINTSSPFLYFQF